MRPVLLDPVLAPLVADLVRIGRKVVAAGLVVGTGGNLSARLGDADHCVVTAAGAWLDELAPGDFSVVGVDGELRAGHPRPSTETRLHLAAYRARRDVTAAVHVHPAHATLLHAAGREIRRVTLDHAYYVPAVGSVGYLPPGTAELAEAAAAELETTDVVMLGHHGCLAVADSVPLAFQRAANLEAAAAATFRALALGDTETACPPEFLARLDRPEP